MSRLLWPRRLADVTGFPAELLTPLRLCGLHTVADLVATVKRNNPGMLPPGFALGLQIRNKAWQIPADVCRKGGDVLADYLGYPENRCPRDWTDPPQTKPSPQPQPETPVIPVSKIELVSPTQLELHADAGEVVMMSSDQYTEFKKSVKETGHIREPLKRIRGTNTLIDGRHRRQVAIDLGFARVPVIDVDLDGEDPILYMLSSAKDRRHLTPGQRAAQGAKYLARLKLVAKQRQKEGGKKGAEVAGRGRPKESDRVVAEVPQPKPAPAPKSRDEAARLSGSNPKAVTAAAKIQEKAPEVFAQLAAGEISLPAAKKAASPPKDKPPAEQDEPKPAKTFALVSMSGSPSLRPAGAPEIDPNETPLALLTREMEETASWLEERADVLGKTIAPLAAKHLQPLSIEVVRLRGRAGLIRAAIIKAQNPAQPAKEKS